MAHDECGSADEFIRDGLGMVLLDVDHGECDAVGLEEGDGGGNSAEAGLDSGFQLHE